MVLVEWTDGTVFMRDIPGPEGTGIEEPTPDEAKWLEEAIVDAKKTEPFALIVLSGMRGIYGDEMWIGFEVHLDGDLSVLWASEKGNDIALVMLKRHYLVGVDEWRDAVFRPVSRRVVEGL